MTAGKVLIGCSGWDYPEWVGRFYPARGQVDRLARYSQVFPVVEVDSSFYNIPTERTVERWDHRTPRGFRFAAKFPQEITHRRRLEDCAEPLEAHYRAFHPLIRSGKVVAFLLQLPPSLPFDESKVRGFYATLPTDPPVAVEFREKSWLCPASYDLLREYHLSTTIVDEPFLPADLTLTNPDLAYMRWHGRGTTVWYDYRYSRDELKAWVPRVEEVASKAKLFLGFFNNHFRGDAPANALEIDEMLGIGPPPWSGRLDQPAIPSASTAPASTDAP
ncbi:MAG: DUF72 domain-containing protein [Euryarchaeota archaeon]|nr:DUF72 domain-containing protein [Euryarchaeota archaeon]MDE1879792.1 DUF72 domain-containing protein [Euryarchaeota archaeon]MDE2044758.1 DUF72 domain-containing protein [Thermoplasmata archaeon]